MFFGRLVGSEFQKFYWRKAAGEMSEVASKKGEYPVCLFAASGH
jgi:hypothetical protein